MHPGLEAVLHGAGSKGDLDAKSFTEYYREVACGSSLTMLTVRWASSEEKGVVSY